MGLNHEPRAALSQPIRPAPTAPQTPPAVLLLTSLAGLGESGSAGSLLPLLPRRQGCGCPQLDWADAPQPPAAHLQAVLGLVREELVPSWLRSCQGWALCEQMVSREREANGALWLSALVEGHPGRDATPKQQGR